MVCQSHASGGMPSLIGLRPELVLMVVAVGRLPAELSVDPPEPWARRVLQCDKTLTSETRASQ